MDTTWNRLLRRFEPFAFFLLIVSFAVTVFVAMSLLFLGHAHAQAAAPAVPAPVALPAAASAAGAIVSALAGGMDYAHLITFGMSIAVPIVLGILHAVWKQDAAAKEAKVAKWIDLCYHITTEISEASGNPAFDKVAYALSELDKHLSAAGIPVTDQVKASAQATWTAMSGAEKRMVSISQQASIAAPPALNAAPPTATGPGTNVAPLPSSPAPVAPSNP